MLLEIYACLEFCVNSERARSYKSRRTFPLDFIKVKRHSILKYGKLFFKIAFKILDRIRLGSEARLSLSITKRAERFIEPCIYQRILEQKERIARFNTCFTALSICYTLIIL